MKELERLYKELVENYSPTERYESNDFKILLLKLINEAMFAILNEKYTSIANEFIDSELNQIKGDIILFQNDL